MTGAKITEEMYCSFSRLTALKLVYHLSRANSGDSPYKVAEQILKQAVEDVSAGRDPGDRVTCVNGRIVAVDFTGDCRAE